MTAFQKKREETENKVIVELLSEIERNPSFTQRSLAAEMGIALGLMNQYLKRFVSKGWVRATQVSPKRISYFLTPQGMKEKGVMVKDYLARSLTFFRDARLQCEEIFADCITRKWTRIALVQEGDLADIAFLVAQGMDITVEIVELEADMSGYDAVMITDVMNPQGTYDALKAKLDPTKILTMHLLHISKEAA